MPSGGDPEPDNAPSTPHQSNLTAIQENQEQEANLADRPKPNPEPDNFFAFDRATMLFKGHNIGHDLTRMRAVGQPIDHWNGCMP